MQNFILITLIIGLGFFLYLLQSGEISTSSFNIRNLQGPVRFDIVANDTKKSGSIKLDVKGTLYDVYSFNGIDFNHVPRSEYYMDIYRIPLEAKDAIAGIWLGSRYVFYVVEEEIDGSQVDTIYRVYKTEYQTDMPSDIQYTQFKAFRDLDAAMNTLEVSY